MELIILSTKSLSRRANSFAVPSRCLCFLHLVFAASASRSNRKEHGAWPERIRAQDLRVIYEPTTFPTDILSSSSSFFFYTTHFPEPRFGINQKRLALTSALFFIHSRLPTLSLTFFPLHTSPSSSLHLTVANCGPHSTPCLVQPTTTWRR